MEKIIKLWNYRGTETFTYTKVSELRKVLRTYNIKIHKSVELGNGVTIGSNSTIGEKSSLGDGTWIGEYVRIGNETHIKDSCHISCGVEIGDEVQILKCVTIDNLSKIEYKCSIGPHTLIKAKCHIEYEAKIGNGCKIDGHILIPPKFELGPFSRISKQLVIGGDWRVIYFGTNIHIGCQKHSYNEWIENGLEIARKHSFTEDKIKEYRGYIELCNTLKFDNIIN